MLMRVTVRDIVLADRLDIVFGQGLNVITGETGAGKSLVSVALSLALGSRSRAALVRPGADRGEVKAYFDIPAVHPVHRALVDNHFPDERTLVLHRIQMADGRTRGFINDTAASIGFLRSVGLLLAGIHGQHGILDMLQPSQHRFLLDAFGGFEPDVQDLRVLWRKLDGLHRFAADQEAKAAVIARDRAYWEHMLNELDGLAPCLGEEASLAEQRSAMMQMEKVSEDLDAALGLIEGDGDCLSRFMAILTRLERSLGANRAPFDESLTLLDRVVADMSELRDALRKVRGCFTSDPQEIGKVEERLFSLRGAARKHGLSVDELPGLRTKIRADLDALDIADEAADLCGRQIREAEDDYRRAAEELSRRRRDVAGRLDASVMAELEPLKLGHIRFLTEITADTSVSGEHGFDHVQFLVQTNAGSPWVPVQEAASGGELSRLVLALQVALAGHGSASTLIFDEADSGVGGAVADAIGQRFANLSKTTQVIVVTHSPQVAARAHHHVYVSKSSNADQTVMEAQILDLSKRQEEIARMLSGEDITDEARAQAFRLLDAVS